MQLGPHAAVFVSDLAEPHLQGLQAQAAPQVQTAQVQAGQLLWVVIFKSPRLPVIDARLLGLPKSARLNERATSFSMSLARSRTSAETSG